MKCDDCGRKLEPPWGGSSDTKDHVWTCDYGHEPRVMCADCADRHPCPAAFPAGKQPGRGVVQLTRELRQAEKMLARERDMTASVAEWVAQRDAIVDLAWDLSTWAATIRWDRRDTNTAEWLAGLRQRIDAFQDAARPLVKHEDGGGTRVSVEQWNARMHVADPVTVTLDDGREVETVLTSGAWMLGGHTPVVMTEAIRGCYLLERVRPREAR